MKMEGVAPQAFMMEGKCANGNVPEGASFFPKAGQNKLANGAKAYCKGTDDNEPCPVLFMCGEWAATTFQPAGIWGGMTTSTLRKALRDGHFKFSRPNIVTGDWLGALRKHVGLSQPDVAALLDGVTLKNVAFWDQGLAAPPEWYVEWLEEQNE